MKSISTLFILYFKSDMIYIQPDQREKEIYKLLHKFFSIAFWLNTEVHLLVYLAMNEHVQDRFEKRRMQKYRQDIYQNVKEELAQIHYPRTTRPTILHLISGDQKEDLFELIESISPNFLCFEDGEIAEDTLSENIKRELLKRVSVPLLILPKHMPEKILPFQSLIVPLSGERRHSEALFQSLKLAEATDVFVTLLHVSESNEFFSSDLCGIECMSDQMHHEYFYQLDKIVSEGSPRSTLKERKRVTHIAHLSGVTTERISEFMKDAPQSILVLEWKGIWVEGRAEILKDLVKQLDKPILVVKVTFQARSSLKIGDRFREAS